MQKQPGPLHHLFVVTKRSLEVRLFRIWKESVTNSMEDLFEDGLIDVLKDYGTTASPVQIEKKAKAMVLLGEDEDGKSRNAPAFQADCLVESDDAVYLGEMESRIVPEDIGKHKVRLENARDRIKLDSKYASLKGKDMKGIICTAALPRSHKGMRKLKTNALEENFPIFKPKINFRAYAGRLHSSCRPASA